MWHLKDNMETIFEIFINARIQIIDLFYGQWLFCKVISKAC